jgi:hypothetical protein
MVGHHGFGTSRDDKPKQQNKTKQNKGCVTFVAFAIHISKYLKAKEEELWKLKYFHHAKII